MKEKNAFWLSNHATKIESVLLALLILFLPTQLGKHFWPDFSVITGIRVDYLSPTLYTTDILIGILFLVWFGRIVFNPQQNAIEVSKYASSSKESGLYAKLAEASQGSWLPDGAVQDKSKKGFPWRETVLGICILAFLLVNVFSADRVGLSLYYLLKLSEFSFLIYYLSKHIRLNIHLPIIALITSVSVFFQSFLAILQYLQQGSLNGWLYYLGERAFTGNTPGIANAAINGELLLRPYGTFSHPNVLAGYLLISLLFIACFLSPFAKGFIRVFGFIILILGSIALMLTLSRVAIALYLVIILVAFIYWFIKKRPKPTMGIGLLIVAAIADLVLFIGGLAFLQTIVSRFSQTSFFEESFLQRTELIDSAILIIQTNPLLGVGLGHFIPALAPLQDPLSLGLYMQPVHNIYLLVAAETGYLGLGIFLFIIALTYRRLFLHIRLTPLFRPIYLVLTLLLSLVLVLGLFDHYFLTLQQGQLLFAVILGLSWSKVLK